MDKPGVSSQTKNKPLYSKLREPCCKNRRLRKYRCGYKDGRIGPGLDDLGGDSDGMSVGLRSSETALQLILNIKDFCFPHQNARRIIRLYPHFVTLFNANAIYV